MPTRRGAVGPVAVRRIIPPRPAAFAPVQPTTTTTTEEDDILELSERQVTILETLPQALKSDLCDEKFEENIKSDKFDTVIEDFFEIPKAFISDRNRYCFIVTLTIHLEDMEDDSGS